MSKIQVNLIRNTISTATLPYAHYTGVNFKDSVTGDLVWVYNNSGQTTTYLWTQTAQDVAPSQIATGTGLFFVSVAQDSAGAAHVLCEYGGGICYSRITFTRSGGHITGWSITDPFYLPAMTSSLGGTPWNCTISCVYNGNAAERVIIVSLDGNDNNQYCIAVLQGPLDASADSDFLSLAGTASTWTKFPTQTASLNVSAPYCFNATVEQYGSGGNLFFVGGAASRGDVGNYGCSVVGFRATASGATWTVDTANPCTLAAETYESFCLHSCVDDDNNAYFGWCTRTTDTSSGTVGLAKVAASDGYFTANWLSTTFTNQGELSCFPSVCDDGTVILCMVPGDVGETSTNREIKVYSGSTWYTYLAGSTRWVGATDLSWANVGSRGWRNGSVLSWGTTNTSTLGLGSVNVRSGSETGILYDNYSLPVYSGTNTISPTYAPAVPDATNDMHVVVVAQKSTSTSGGTFTFPSGWTSRGSIVGAGGYGSQGADTGNVDIAMATKDSVNGSESGSINITLGSYNTAWAMMVRLTKASAGDWGCVSTTGSDTTGGASLSVVYDSAIALAPGDLVIIGWVQPTDVSSPKQFTAQALAADGITFSEVTVLAEPYSSTGNDIGGWVGFARVLEGTGTVAPTFSATAGGTTTNVMGGSVLLRLRSQVAETSAVIVSSLWQNMMDGNLLTEGEWKQITQIQAVLDGEWVNQVP